jgi:acyl dehydratase
VNHPVTGTRPISELDLVWLAAISMNGSPVHLDADRATRGSVAGPMIVGALTVAMAQGLASQLLAQRVGPLVGWERITLRAPVYVNDVIRVETTDLPSNRNDRGAPHRVRIRAFVRHDELAAELITLFRPADEQ